MIPVLEFEGRKAPPPKPRFEGKIGVQWIVAKVRCFVLPDHKHTRGIVSMSERKNNRSTVMLLTIITIILILGIAVMLTNQQTTVQTSGVREILDRDDKLLPHQRRGNTHSPNRHRPKPTQ